MGSLQASDLNRDSNEKNTSAQWGDLGDGTTQWHIFIKAKNDAITPLGKSADAAVAPGANGNIIQLLKGLLGALKAEDSASASGDLLQPIGVVRRDAPTADAANGDYVPLHVDSLGRLRVVGTHPEDGAHTSGDYGNFVLGVASIARTARSADNDYTPLAVGLAGEVFSPPVPEANSAWALSASDSVALEASRVIKASAGKLYKLRITNTLGSSQFIQLFNSTTVPADTTVPTLVTVVNANSVLELDFTIYGRLFSTGISVSNSSTADTKTIGAADCLFNAQYL